MEEERLDGSSEGVKEEKLYNVRVTRLLWIDFYCTMYLF